MTVFNVIQLFGGLALFLYGMTAMGNGLEKLAGSRLESILRQLTSNPIKAVLLGTVVTAVIQSSSATTVIIVGLVNSGIIQLSQAIGVIMGANIGTTVTAQILRLADLQGDNMLVNFFKPTTLAPMAAAIGIVLYLFFKSAKKHNLGQIFLGFGILFTGMFAMENALSPLRSDPTFISLFSTLQNPLLGVLAGALFTALIQSSSASVGILQAIASTGILPWASAVPIILGQNIGTTITAMLASIGTNRSARRSAIVHVYFNIIGTIVFLIGTYAVTHTIGLPFWNDNITRTGIANFHTIFNITMTLLLLPFTKGLAKLAYMTLPITQEERDAKAPEMPVLDNLLLQKSPGLAIAQSKSALETMGVYAVKTYGLSIQQIFNYNQEEASQAEKIENSTDALEVALDHYLVRITEKDLSAEENREVNKMMTVVTEYERIGDYGISLLNRAGEIHDKGIVFTEAAKTELTRLDKAVQEILDLTVRAFSLNSESLAWRIEPLQQTIERMCFILKEKHIERLKNNQCSVDAGIVFINILQQLERISDHCSNVAALVLAAQMGLDAPYDSHELRRRLHAGAEYNYNQLLQNYQLQYLSDLVAEGDSVPVRRG